MARVKLHFPEKVLFSDLLRIGIADINYGNHLGNDKVLTLAHELRLRFLKSLGYKNEIDFGNRVGTIVADAAIVFKAEGFYGDELRAEVGVSDHHSRGFDMYYRFTRSSDKTEIAVVKTAILFFNYDDRKLVSVPEKLLHQLKELL